MSNKNIKLPTVSHRFDAVIDSKVESVKCFCVDLISNFTRNRILAYKIYSCLQAYSLLSEISDYFISSDKCLI